MTYEAVYPGVDISYHGNPGKLAYDFAVAPGTDPSVIKLGFEGVQGLRVDDHGDLVLTVADGELRQQAPVVYQEGAAGSVPVDGGFRVGDDGLLSFAIGAYDQARGLRIDATLAYSSFLGGAGAELGSSIAVDRQGNAYVVGPTTSPDFPTTPAAYDTSYNGNSDGFVAKLNRNGSALVYSTFLGGSDRDDADSVAVDPRGNAYVRGITQSPDFPTTPGAFDRTFNGGFDAYVAKLSPDGSTLGYSTFLGGANFDSGSGIAVDRRGAAYVSGITGSPEFPTTPGAYQTSFHGVGGPLPPPFGPGDFDAFLTKLDPSGSRLEYSTFLGGSGLDVGFEVAVNLRDEAYVSGLTMSPDFPTTAGAFDTTLTGPLDAFVTKFNRDGSAAEYSTFLGGSGVEGALGLDVDPRGSAYVSGGTVSPDFPTTPEAFDRTFNGGTDVFVTKLTPDGSALAYSTFVGGGGTDEGFGLAVSYLGEAYVTGGTASADFPTTSDAIATTLTGDSDAFLTKLSRDGSRLAFSTYLGGSGFDTGHDVSVDVRGAAYVTGETRSPDFPTTAGAFDSTLDGESDAFVTKISLPLRPGS
ncbi:MAG TPA: SBBP repeat-containing protein [Acidimicrobiales bacterium]|nr:SBBP repeat-containing protein [Acidimicrobiales bacterium]